VRDAGGTAITAEDAFRLHDTSGFPIDLTQVMAEEAGLGVDVAGYERLMEEARERSRASAGGESGFEFPPDAIAALERKHVNPTNDAAKFAGKPITTTVLAIWNGRSFDLHAGVSPERIAIILERTICYAAMGGQVGDVATIRVDRTNAVFEVEDTQRVGPYVLHIGRVSSGRINAGDDASVALDRERRERIRANHTTTHLVNWALREVLGDEVEQRGSLVDDEKLRFDFSLGRAMTPEEISRVEALVNERIAADLAVHAEETALADAKRIAGLRAVFGERYPDSVRVVSIGVPVSALLAAPTGPLGRSHSVELCGGTHLATTGEAKRFAFVQEGGLAAGVRRMTGHTGGAALACEAAAAGLERRIEAARAASDDAFAGEWSDLAKEVEQLPLSVAARRRLEGLLEPLRERAKEIRKRHEGANRASVVAQARGVVEGHGDGACVAVLEDADPAALLAALDMARAKRPELPFLFLSPDDAGGKVAIAASCPKEAIARGLKAGDWVRTAAQACGGSGGGKPDLAQAGGKDPSRLLEAVRAARAFAEGKA
jgi:alanyl-tRNA synthetase